MDDCCFGRDRRHDQPDLIVAECDVDGRRLRGVAGDHGSKREPTARQGARRSGQLTTGKSIPQVPNNGFRLGALGRSDGIAWLSCACRSGAPDWSLGACSGNCTDLVGSLRWSVFVRVGSAMTPPAERTSHKALPADPRPTGGARNHGANQPMVSTRIEGPSYCFEPRPAV